VLFRSEGRGGGLGALIPLLSGDRIREAWERGDVDDAPLMVGQSIGLIKGVLSCKELLDTMAKDATDCLARVNKIIQH
jgi:NAD(P)H-dependent flavin oxidoreductase YrpB (nitropropane dioxygenase family)